MVKLDLSEIHHFQNVHEGNFIFRYILYLHLPIYFTIFSLEAKFRFHYFIFVQLSNLDEVVSASHNEIKHSFE